jgi:hypothetical protein
MPGTSSCISFTTVLHLDCYIKKGVGGNSMAFDTLASASMSKTANEYFVRPDPTSSGSM